MALRLRTHTIILGGSHSTPGRQGTVLDFEVHLSARSQDDRWDAELHVRNTVPLRSGAIGTAESPQAAILKLADNLRRVVESLDQEITEIVLPPLDARSPS